MESDWATSQGNMLPVDSPPANNTPLRKRNVVLPNDDFGAEGHIFIGTMSTIRSTSGDARRSRC